MYFKNIQEVKNLTDALKIISNILIKQKVEHFVFFGTLLGLIRDKKLIRDDDDIDFYVNIKDRRKLIKLLLKKKIDVILNKKPNTTNYFLQVNLKHNKQQTKIDFYFYTSNKFNQFIVERWNFDGKPFDKEKFLRIPKVFIFPIIKQKINNIHLQLPNKPELTCEYIYGSKWGKKIKKDTEYEMKIIDGKPILISYINSYKLYLAPFRFKNLYLSLKKIIHKLLKNS